MFTLGATRPRSSATTLFPPGARRIRAGSNLFSSSDFHDRILIKWNPCSRPMPKRLTFAYGRTQVISRTLFLVGLIRSEEHTSELQSQSNLVCRLLLEKKKTY